ncbi:hypothetical protein GLOIN_2v1778669 [Rhizophagus irregularis DAOM 181602=DAOM 197198]|nr:hypothetical protein GLOIN_2v1778669 [Rhizophagus irregularis DAOM 181602=DAOM 197198]
MRSIEHQIFYFPEAKTRFKTLCELKCDTSIDSSYFYGLACICQYIQSIIIINVKTESNPGLVKLIEVQKNLKYFEWIDDFNDDDLADPYKDIFLELEKKGDILNHLVLFFQWIEGLDYHYKSMQNLLPKLHKIKTLIINDISFVDETLSKLLVYNDLETLNVSYITVYEASIIIENSGGRLKEVSLKPCRFLMCATPNNLRELRFLIKFEFSLKVFEEFLKEWRGRPALSILTSDPIYENEDYKNLINNYKNEGIIKAFKVESIWNIENMNFKIQ